VGRWLKRTTANVDEWARIEIVGKDNKTKRLARRLQRELLGLSRRTVMSSDIEQEIGKCFGSTNEESRLQLYHRVSLPIVLRHSLSRRTERRDGDGTYVEHRRRRCNSCV